MAMKSLEDLFVHMLQDVYNAEKQVLKALPRMSEKARSSDLRKAIDLHYKETQGQVERLEKVFKLCDLKVRGETCEAAEGLLAEGKEVMSKAEKGDVLDAGLIAAAQAFEHYEIARYGTLVAWAKELGHSEAATLLAQTLKEEHNADNTLNEIAMRRVNKQAA